MGKKLRCMLLLCILQEPRGRWKQYQVNQSAPEIKKTSTSEKAKGLMKR